MAWFDGLPVRAAWLDPGGGAFAGCVRAKKLAGLAWDARSIFAPLGARVHCEPAIEALVAVIAAEARDGDQVLVMSNGSFGGIHDKLLAALRG